MRTWRKLWSTDAAMNSWWSSWHHRKLNFSKKTSFSTRKSFNLFVSSGDQNYYHKWANMTFPHNCRHADDNDDGRNVEQPKSPVRAVQTVSANFLGREDFNIAFSKWQVSSTTPARVRLVPFCNGKKLGTRKSFSWINALRDYNGVEMIREIKFHHPANPFKCMNLFVAQPRERINQRASSSFLIESFEHYHGC